MTRQPAAARPIDDPPRDTSRRSTRRLAIDSAASVNGRTAHGDSRRAPHPPTRIQHEILRSRLVDRFGERFDIPVTVLHAGAGFGKTTAIAQAMRANIAAPRGIDVWIACEAHDEDERQLASAVVAAVAAASGRPPEPSRSVGGKNVVDHVVATLSSLAPVDVCLILDDAHEIGTTSSGHRLLAELIRLLPYNSHLVISGRNDTALPLARLRAAGRVNEIGERDLTFTEDEVAAVARLSGADSEQARDVAGWPSLVQLALAARPGAVTAFLWEEIIGALAPADRIGMLALATLGSGTAHDIEDVAGTPVDVEQLVAAIPLTYSDDRGRYGVHDLWEEAIERVFAHGELTDVRRRALATMHRRGDTVRLGSTAARWGDDDWLRTAALKLLSETWGGFPVDVAQRWLSNATPSARSTAELRLLAVAIRQHLDPTEPGLDCAIDELIQTFRACGNQRGEVRAIALGSVIAFGRTDYVRLMQIADQARCISGSDNIPALRFLVGSVDAAMASLRGDVETSLHILSTLPVHDVPDDARKLMIRLEAMMLMLTGHGDLAVDAIARLGQTNDDLSDDLLAFLTWQAGTPGRFLTDVLRFEPAAMGGLGDQIVYASEIVAISAGLGNTVVMSEAAVWLNRLPRGSLDARHSAFVAVADACVAAYGVEDGTGVRSIADHLTAHVGDALVAELHLRRHPAIGYVLNDALREWWRRSEPGPTHQRNIEVAQWLLDSRSGRMDPRAPVPEPGVAITSMPLPWTIELGLRAHVLGHAEADGFIANVVEMLGGRALAELDRHIDGTAPTSDDSLAHAAAALRSHLSGSPSACLTVEVLGPLRISAGGHLVDPPDLRRGRVRTVLALLVVCGQLRRDQLTDLLWPDASPSDSRRNLRVTLSRVRNVLGAGNPRDGQLRLRADDEYVSLAEEPVVRTDLARFRRHVAAAGADTASGSAAIAELTKAVELWRADPLSDLQSITGTETDVEIVRQELVGAALRLGELLHVAGRFDEAWKYAALTLTSAPYAERAHRLAIAAQLHRRDRDGVVTAVRAAMEMFDDLGVTPDEATQMLLRRASAFTGEST